MTATEMATELGERIKQEGEKLRALEVVPMALRKEAPKSRSKFKTVTLMALLFGVGYTIFRSLRSRTTAQDAFTPPAPNQRENGTEPLREHRVATAGV